MTNVRRSLSPTARVIKPRSTRRSRMLVSVERLCARPRWSSAIVAGRRLVQIHPRDAEVVGVVEPRVRHLAALERARQLDVRHEYYDIVVFKSGQTATLKGSPYGAFIASAARRGGPCCRAPGHD